MNTALGFRTAKTEAKGESVLHLDVFDVVGESFWFDGVTAKDVLEQVRSAGNVSRIVVNVNSIGGFVDDGIAIHNLLKGHKAKSVARVSGISASIATVIMLGCDMVEVANNARIMIHEAATGVMGNAQDMDRAADELRKVNVSIAATYAEAAAKRGKTTTAEEFAALMAKETWFTAAEAVEIGLADKVIKGVDLAACASWDTRAIAQFRNVPDSIYGAINARIQSLGAQNQRMEKSEMNVLTSILALLAVDEEKALETVQALKNKASENEAVIGKVNAITGKTGDESLGVIMAWRDDAKKLEGVQAENAALKAEQSKREITDVIEGEDAKKKLTKAERDEYRRQIEAGETSINAVRSMLAVKSVLNIAPENEPTPPRAKANERAGLVHNGKSYEEMTNQERVALLNQDEKLFDEIHRDWEKRGCPIVDLSTQ